MRTLHFGLLLFFLFVSVSGQAQQSAMSTTPGPTVQPGEPPWFPAPVRDPKAVEVVELAIKALGGDGAIGAIQSYVVHAEFEAPPESQAKSGSVVWKVSGLEFAATITNSSGINTTATGHGKPFNLDGGNVDVIPPHVSRALIAPPLVGSILVKELRDSKYSLIDAGPGAIESQSVRIVETRSLESRTGAIVTHQTWYFDSKTGLPLRLEYRLPDKTYPTRYLPAAFDFSDYQPVLNVLYPFQIARSVALKAAGNTRISSINANPTIAPSEFDAPVGGVQ